MKKYIIFMDQKTKQLKDISYFLNDTHFSANLTHILKAIMGYLTTTSKIYMEALRNKDSQDTPEEETR